MVSGILFVFVHIGFIILMPTILQCSNDLCVTRFRLVHSMILSRSECIFKECGSVWIFIPFWPVLQRQCFAKILHWLENFR